MEWYNIISLIFGFVGGGGGLISVISFKAIRKGKHAEAQDKHDDVLIKRVAFLDNRLTAAEQEIERIKPKICNRTTCKNRL